jgi:hypothetical protein
VAANDPLHVSQQFRLYKAHQFDDDAIVLLTSTFFKCEHFVLIVAALF